MKLQRKRFPWLYVVFRRFMYCTLKWCVHLRGQTHSLIAIPLLGQVQLMVIAWPTESRMADQGIVARMKMLSDAVAGGGHSMLSTTAALNLESRSLPSAEHLRGENVESTTQNVQHQPLRNHHYTVNTRHVFRNCGGKRRVWSRCGMYQYVHSQRPGQIRPPE